MKNKRHWCLLWSLLALITTQSEALADVRIALVIGNGAYLNAPKLPNPPNDAEDVAVALQRDGFQTTVLTDLDKNKMEDATIAFAKAAREADVALFYYSGHALQFSGVNYLAPIDINLSDEADLRRMVRVDEIISDLQQAKSLRILVLDACRDNPLADQLKRSIGSTRALSLQNGLAKIDARGIILSYATQAGQTADDGDGRNSPYTRAFLRHIEEQEEVGTIFRRISNDVYESTAQKQLPELSLSITGEFYLRGRVQIVPGQTPAPELIPDDQIKARIDAPESVKYFVIHENVQGRRGPDAKTDGLFRLPIRSQVTALAEYNLNYSETDDKFPAYAIDHTWVRVVTDNGKTGFVLKTHLLAPNQFKVWSDHLDVIPKMDEFFVRAEKENSGPFAKYKGVYCTGTCKLDPVLNNPGTRLLHLSLSYLMWFQGDTIHLVKLGNAREQVGTMTLKKSVSFSQPAEPPFKNVKNIPGVVVTWSSSAEDWAFNDTHIFTASHGDNDYHYLVKETPLAARLQLKDEIPMIAEGLGHFQKVTSTAP